MDADDEAGGGAGGGRQEMMPRLHMLAHPHNWVIVGAMLFVWLCVAFLIETGLEVAVIETGAE